MKKSFLIFFAFVLFIFPEMCDTQSVNAETVRLYAEYPSSPLGVFEEGEVVEIKLLSEDGSAISETLTVVDYNGNEVYRHETEDISSGTEITLSDLPIGHYTIKFGASQEDYFAVIVPQSDRKKYNDTPFAADMAAVWSVPLDKHPDYVEAVKRAGVLWVRERLSWEQINYKSDYYDLSTLSYEALGEPRKATRYDLFLKNYTDAGIKVLPMLASQASGTARGWNTTLSKFNPGTVTTNLKKAYDYGYYIGSELGEIGAYELWNEPDLGIYSYESPDMFAAMIKAMAIGVKDGSNGQPVALPGLASRKKSYFVDVFLRNDALEYGDMYNFHIHRQPGNASELLKHLPSTIQNHNDLLSAYNLEDMPRIVTECGLLTAVEMDKGSLTLEQQKISANYNVVSTVESISQGTDKHYWYLFRSSYAGASDTGMFNIYHHPTMIYSAEAAMTHLLGEGKYVGVLNNLPSGAYGYIFESEGKHTAVLFAESDCTFTGSLGSASSVYDIAGTLKATYASGADVSITLSESPTYLALDGVFAADIYTSSERTRSSEAKENYSEAQRVILNQIYPNIDSGGNEQVHPMYSALHTDVNYSGYKIDSDEVEISVEVTNLNPNAVTGTIYGNGFSFADIEPSSQTVELDAWEKKELVFKVKVQQSAPENQLLPITFYGEFGGEKTTKCVSIYMKENYDNAEYGEEFADITTGWRKSSSSTLTITTTTKDERSAVCFVNSWDADFTRDRWSCPSIAIADSIKLKDTQGLVIEYYAETPQAPEGGTAPSYENATFSVLVTENTSGAVYKESPGYTLEPGKWHKIYIPWSRFGIHSGTDDNMALDPEEIIKISPSLNTTENGIFTHYIASINTYKLNEQKIYCEPTGLSKTEVSSLTPALELLMTNEEIGIDIENTTALIDGLSAKVEESENGLTVTAQNYVLKGEHELKVYLRYDDGTALLYEDSFVQTEDISPIVLNGQDFKTGAEVKRSMLDTDGPVSSPGSTIDVKQLQLLLKDGAAVSEDGLWASVEFYAPESGMYSFSGLISNHTSQYYSPYYIKINNGEYIAAADMVSSSSDKYSQNLVNTVFNDIYLGKGINTITFMINEERAHSSGGYYLRIADITLKLNSVKGGQASETDKAMLVNIHKYGGSKGQLGVVMNVVVRQQMTAVLIIAEYDINNKRLINVHLIDDYMLSEGNNMINLSLGGVFSNAMLTNRVKIFAISDKKNIMPLTSAVEI